MGMSFSECRGLGLLLLLFTVIDMPAAAQEKDRGRQTGAGGVTEGNRRVTHGTCRVESRAAR